jgi:signal transduction histidine kinase
LLIFFLYHYLLCFIDIIFFSLAIGYRNRKEFDSLNLNLLEEANKQIALQQLVLQKQSELENERNRIAADMHDDLGSGLTRITYLSQMALHNDTQNNL